jgi:hypothetical protein
MQCFDNGVFFTVTVTKREIQDFANKWPCSGFRTRPVTFQFDKRNGDLVDSNDSQQHPNADGAALVALSQDAMKYGAKRLKLELLEWHPAFKD